MSAPKLYGPQPGADNPTDGLDACADALEALAGLILHCKELDQFVWHPGNNAADGLWVLFKSIADGVRHSSKVLHSEHILRNRHQYAPQVLKDAEAVLARLKCGGT